MLIVKEGDGMKKMDYLKKYIISSYVLIWALIIFVAGSASLIFHAPPVMMWIVQIGRASCRERV